MPPVTPDEFRDVIGRFATGVTVVTARDEAPYGTTASAVSSVSLEPPMLLICMNKTSATGQAISRSGRFAVNILGEDQPELATRFASKGGDKFRDLDVERGIADVPLLAGALATLDCRVREEARGGTHTVFIADVERAAGRAGSPLAYFRGQFGRFSVEQDESAYSEVRRRIVSGDLPVGEVLHLDRVAAELDVPRGAVYHALSKLNGEGLVSRSPEGRYMVPPVTRDVVLDALPALFSIWLGAMHLTMGRVSETQLAELRERVDALRPPDAADRAWTSEQFQRAREAFFDTFFAVPASTALKEAWARADLPAFILLRWSDEADLNRAAYEALHGCYVEVLTAYEAADPTGTTRAVQRFMDYTRGLIESTFEQ